MQTNDPAWYGARTKLKHEHIAAANLCKNLDLEVFFPRLRLEKITRRGLVRVVEPLFPCYIFVHCVIEDRIAEIQHTSGIRSIVHFGSKIPVIPDLIIEELQSCFELDDIITVESRLAPGDAVMVADGAFAGMPARVLKNLPAKKRVQILLEILGRPTSVEVGQNSVIQEKNSLAEMAPILAAAPSRPNSLRVS
jgi:transcriptional antiterminator RfaH